MFEEIKRKGGINVDATLKPAVINTLPIPPFIKEGLSHLNYSDSSKSFEEALETEIYNVVGVYGIRMINLVAQRSQGCSSRLSKISKMLE